MKKVISLLMLLSVQCLAVSPLQVSANLENEIMHSRLPESTQKALDAAFQLGAEMLREKGYVNEGNAMENEWNSTYRAQFLRFAHGERDIGDHQPLNFWIAQQYNKLESLLGIDICKKTHLSDIKTFNFTIPIVFRPCNFQMDNVKGERIDEYRNHFSSGQVYFGLVPCSAYWITYAAVVAATSGTGYVIFAGMIGDLAEKLIVFITPRLSDTIYTKACG